MLSNIVVVFDHSLHFNVHLKYIKPRIMFPRICIFIQVKITHMHFSVAFFVSIEYKARTYTDRVHVE